MWFLVVMAAQAATVSDCSPGDAPSAYDGYGCGGVCTVSGDNTHLECSPSDEPTGLCESSAGAEAWIVSSYATDAYENFSAFGTTNTGAGFCCYIDESDEDAILDVTLNGGGGDDALSFKYGSSDLHAYIPGEIFSGFINGYGCRDTITGSDDLNVNFWGLGTDFLHGGNGADLIYGEMGGDVIWGEDGDDYIYGKGGNDLILGGSGTDYLSGAAGTNTLCAGTTTEADYFVAVGASTFWAPGTGTAPTGNAPAGSACGARVWGASWAGSGCFYGWFMMAPAAC